MISNNLIKEIKFTGNWYFDIGMLGLIFLNEEFTMKYLGRSLTLSDPNRFKIDFVKSLLIREIRGQVEKKIAKKIGKELDRDKLEEIFRKNLENLQKNEDSLKEDKDGLLKAVDEVYNEFQKNFLEDIISIIQDNKLKEELEKHRKKEKLFIHSDFYMNFRFFDAYSTLKGQKNSFVNYFEDDVIPFQKEFNKFLPSLYKAPNEFFVESRLIEPSGLSRELLRASLLCIPYSFINIEGLNYVFYSPDEQFCYMVNKKLREFVNMAKARLYTNIFLLTWEKVFDVLLEYKSIWSLSNMYLIRYKKIKDQRIEGVEYVGIDKLKAGIIINDEIRRKLNIKINMKRNENLWLIVEFLKGSSIIEIILRYEKNKLAESPNQGQDKLKNNLILAACVEYVLRSKIGKNFEHEVFKYKNIEIEKLIYEIKNLNNFLIKINKIFYKIVNNDKGLIFHLLSLIEKERKLDFVNEILRIINRENFVYNNNQEERNNQKEKLLRWVSENILFNDSVLWKNLGVCLIV